MQEVNLIHENHQSDKLTYEHYPENLRLEGEQKKEVEKLVALGTNKYRIKSHLLKNGTEVTLKYLHNIQTLQHESVQQSHQENELKKLLDELQKIPGAKIRVFTNDDDELIGIFIQFSENIE